MTVTKFILIDYSEVFFSKISKSQVPSERGGKFIQIRNDDTEYLVFSPREHSSFHANIVERFCVLNELTGEYTTKKRDEYEITDPDWIIIGGVNGLSMVMRNGFICLISVESMGNLTILV